MLDLAHIIFDTSYSFEKKCMRVFEQQKLSLSVYGRFCEALGISEVSIWEGIPLLPIQAFKDSDIFSTDKQPPLFFQSSGTSGMQRSTHFISDPDLYKQSIIEGMRQFYNMDDYVLWAYTPGYNENPHSSLVWMLRSLIENDTSGFSKFLELNEPLDIEEIARVNSTGKRLMIFGAAFGLIDLAEQFPISLPRDTIIMETGGMKTYAREMSRSELHTKLATSFHLPLEGIHSEYGMTELLSQAYSLGDDWFVTPPWMKVSIRNPENPLKVMPIGEEGLIGVIDLANLNSCAFLLTGDKGVSDAQGRFQVLGRWNSYNLRGCNFLIDQD